MCYKYFSFLLFLGFLNAQDLPPANWKNVDYAGDNQIYHMMDIYLPQRDQKTYPVVITIYGSAWRSNKNKATKYIKKTLIKPLLNSGFAVVSINHRSSSDAIFPAQIHDVKAAIRFIRAHAKSYQFNTNFIGVTGSSSGGHLSAIAGTTSWNKSMEGEIGQYLEFSSHVNAVVDWFGPTDFLIMDQCGSKLVHDAIDSPESQLIGGAIQDHPQKVLEANPLHYISKKTPPFLIIHGNKDKVVPSCQSEVLVKALEEKGIPSELVLIEEGKHGPGVLVDQFTKKMGNFFLNQYNKR